MIKNSILNLFVSKAIHGSEFIAVPGSNLIENPFENGNPKRTETSLFSSKCV
jgi:hypothetical protein